jgi:hypothetical protein
MQRFEGARRFDRILDRWGWIATMVLAALLIYFVASRLAEGA